MNNSGIDLEIEAMGQIKIEKNVGGIEGLCVITPAVHGDARGYFMETYSQRDMEENGIYQGNPAMKMRKREIKTLT